MIADNLESVRRRIAKCCERIGRTKEDVRLVCVTKKASVDDVREALAAGAAILGENRVQDALLKRRAIGDKPIWHLVGHLQTNKAKDAVRTFSLIHSVDSIRLAKSIDREAAKIGKVQDILLQVNTSGESSKFGVEPGNAIDLFNEVGLYPNIKILGLMTIAPEVDDPEKARPFFRLLRELRDKINGLRITDDGLRILSMGMTNDFEIAIEEGSSMVRIGSAIFAPPKVSKL